MFIINPPLEEFLPGAPFLRYLSASWHIVNVPTESISKTANNNENGSPIHFSYLILG